VADYVEPSRVIGLPALRAMAFDAASMKQPLRMQE
jgi:hypothetical protein